MGTKPPCLTFIVRLAVVMNYHVIDHDEIREWVGA